MSDIHVLTRGVLQANLNPTYSKDEIRRVDKKAAYAHALDGTNFLPGVFVVHDTHCLCMVDFLGTDCKPVGQEFFLRHPTSYKNDATLSVKDTNFLLGVLVVYDTWTLMKLQRLCMWRDFFGTLVCFVLQHSKNVP